MTRFRKILTAGLAALTLGATVAATVTPADAWGRRGVGPNPAGPNWHGGNRVGGWRGGPGWRGGYGYGYGRGWGGPGPWVAGAVGGLALGAMAAGAYNGYGYGYGYGCVANRPLYDSWGNFLGYQRVRVACY